MDEVIKYHFQNNIKNKIELTGGYSFKTWLLILSNNQKVVFRTRDDFVTSGGRKVTIADIFKRENFFYDNINKKIGHICPEVYIVDDTRKYYEKPYQISEYIEGTSLNLCFKDFDTQEQNNILYRIGEITAKINKIEIDKQHPYVTNRISWEEFIADRLYDRLFALIKNNIITLSEIEKITNNLRKKKVDKTLSFLHLDMRRANIIYKDSNLFILDAEKCEFGDPLFELATIDVARELNSSLLEGYKNAYGDNVNLDNDIYSYYKMEKQALVLNLFANSKKKDMKSAMFYLKKFYEMKNKLLNLSE